MIMADLWIDIIILLITTWTALYFYFTRDFNHWKEKKVPFIKPIPFFGNALQIFTLKKSIGDLSRDIYKATTEPFIGLFICDKPYLLVRDPELIKTILIKDFNIFIDRSVYNNTRDDPLGSHLLFLLKSPNWRDVRKKITPVFTSGKMKVMYKLVKETGKELVEYLEKEVSKNAIVEVKEVSAKYTTEAITSTAFGINANCFKDENAEFRVVSRRIFNFGNLERAISTTCYFMAPSLVKLFRLKFIDTKSAQFLRDTFWKTMNEREKSKFVRNDLLDILIEMKNEEKQDDAIKLEGDILVAQAAQFFMAGYETSSTTITFALYELAANPDIQKTLREEVLDAIRKHGEISYDALQEMEYLDKCIKETLRKYPSLPFLDRKCDVDYTIPNTDIVLKKGTPVLIPSWGLHFDPQYFPDPEKFDPMRFTEEKIKERPPFTYLPFGEGPRNCIGARFGTVSSKCSVAHIVSKFELELTNKDQYPVKIDPKGFLIAPIGGLSLKFSRYKD